MTRMATPAEVTVRRPGPQAVADEAAGAAIGVCLTYAGVALIALSFSSELSGVAVVWFAR
jgi:hypothetical protein